MATVINILAHIFGALFGACIIFLQYVSSVTGMTYKATCTLINLYVQGGIIALLPLFILGCVIANKHLNRRKMWLIAVGAYCGINLLNYLGMFLHYGLDMNVAYDMCYKELMDMSECLAKLNLYDFSTLNLSFTGKSLQMTDEYVYYGIINLAFFVVAFLANIGFDIWLGLKLLRQNRSNR